MFSSSDIRWIPSQLCALEQGSKCKQTHFGYNPRELQALSCTRRKKIVFSHLLCSSLDGTFVGKSEEVDKTGLSERPSIEKLVPGLHDGFTKEVVLLVIPSLLALAIEPLAQLMETAYMGRLGAVELAAVGVSISAFNLISKTFNIPLLNVTTSFVAEDEASNKAPNINGATNIQSGKQVLPSVSSSLVLGGILGITESFLLGFGGNFVLGLMGVTPGSVMQAPAGWYLALRAIGAPAVVLSLALQGVFRGFKDTKTPLYATVTGSLANIALAPVFMFGLGYGVGGAAAAYVVSQYLMMGYLLWKLSQRVILLPPRLKDLNIDRFMKSGGLLLGRTVSIIATMTLATSMAARQGAVPMAAHQICMQLWLAASLLSDSLAIAVQTIIASEFARGEGERAKEAAFRVLQMGLVLGIVMAAGLAWSSTSLSKAFTNDEAVLKVMSVIMPFVALTQPINSLAFVFDGIHYGASDFSYAAYSMMISGALSSLILFVAPSFFGLTGVWIGLCTIMSLRAASGFLRLLQAQGPWARKAHAKQLEIQT